LVALERAEQGHPAMVLVAGDAGVGKTRLLVELADRAQQRGVRVLTGGCVELGDIGLAYLPVVDALGGLTDDPDDAALVAEVASIAPPAGRARDLLEADREPERLGERLQRRQQMRVRVAGHRLTWRLQRGRLHAVERRDLGAVKHRDALEQHPCFLLGVLRVAGLDRHRRDDPIAFSPLRTQYRAPTTP
jgi:hypothetical protein